MYVYRSGSIPRPIAIASEKTTEFSLFFSYICNLILGKLILGIKFSMHGKKSKLSFYNSIYFPYASISVRTYASVHDVQTYICLACTQSKKDLPKSFNLDRT